MLVKWDFTRKCTDGPRRRFRSLAEVWSSKESWPELERVGSGGHPDAMRHPRPLRGGMPMTPPSHGQERLRQVDLQLLGQLCSLGLEMGALREELFTFLEEESLIEEEEEEEEEPEGKQEEGHLGAFGSALHHQPPDFEMTI